MACRLILRNQAPSVMHYVRVNTAADTCPLVSNGRCVSCICSVMLLAAEPAGDDEVDEDDLAEEDDEDYEEGEKPPAKKAKDAAKLAAKGAAGKAAGGKKGGQADQGITQTSLACHQEHAPIVLPTVMVQ